MIFFSCTLSRCPVYHLSFYVLECVYAVDANMGSSVTRRGGSFVCVCMRELCSYCPHGRTHIYDAYMCMTVNQNENEGVVVVQ